MEKPQQDRDLEVALAKLRRADWKTRPLEEIICELGSSDTDYFGGTFRGGLQIQQVPEELAACARFLLERDWGLESYLEIGVGMFGTFLFLAHLFDAHGLRPRLYFADDFGWMEAEQRDRARFICRNYAVAGFYQGDTGSPCFDRFLTGKRFDAILIDGDHSREGVWNDFVKVAPHLNRGGLLLFHDIASHVVPAVGEVYREAKGHFHRSREFVASTTCGIGVLWDRRWDRPLPTLAEGDRGAAGPDAGRCGR